MKLKRLHCRIIMNVTKATTNPKVSRTYPFREKLFSDWLAIVSNLVKLRIIL